MQKIYFEFFKKILYVFLDKNRDGTIDYDEFLVAIRVILMFNIKLKGGIKSS